MAGFHSVKNTPFFKHSVILLSNVSGYCIKLNTKGQLNGLLKITGKMSDQADP